MVEMWGSDHRDRMVIAAGLVPRVRQILTEHGYRVTVTDHRVFGERFAISRKFLRSAEGEDQRLLDAVCRKPMGQIEVASPRDMIDKLTKIIFLHPKARVLIPVATRTLARKIRWQMHHVEMDRGVFLYGDSWPASRAAAA